MDTAGLENGLPILHMADLGFQKQIYLLSDQQLEDSVNTLIPIDHALPNAFWDSYNAKQTAIGRRACLLLWIASGSRFIPREFQLKATIAILSGQDSLIDVGTGYGKTFCMILPLLLCPDTISIIISPLKRLQAVQVVEFGRYGVRTVAINEDTPNDPSLWKVCLNVLCWSLVMFFLRIFKKGGTRHF